ncbi:hypothetical protein LWC33_10365 [Pseudonocardia sp. RS11V-5]|uniref:hypothetical protein n=1 Tax=Pseudonocardia terrae TaxID=2905831 RepID=UPI001E37ABCA|nr:hypothetical protein [Pseudonocardia terrae]MCE3551859.1 hypothetical protein [Pseudonocardia terrae]
MRLVFAPGDDQGYAGARDRLLEAFLTWARRRRVSADVFLVAAALDYKYALDRRLGRWTRAHVADALGMWFPRHVTVLDAEEVPEAFHALIDFLADADGLDHRSASRAELHAQVRDSTPALLDGIADERNYDLGKFWGVQLRRHGVDPADPRAVQRFLDRARSGEVHIDRAALAEITRREQEASRDPAPAPELPPVLLPSAAEMVVAAQDSTALDLLRKLTVWVRAGRRLTRDGKLGLADALSLADLLGLDQLYRDSARSSTDLPETSMLLHWAKAARLVRSLHGRLVPVKSAAKDLHRPIELWRRVFGAVGRIGDHLGGTDVFGAPSLFGMSLADAFPILWLELYAAGGGPVPVELFHRLVREAVNEECGCVVDDLAGDAEQRLWRRDVTALLDALELLGAVELGELLDAEDLDGLVELAGRDDPDPTIVSLTPMGLWAVHETLIDQGLHAPLPGELADEDLEYVCVRMSEVRSAVAEAELDAWVAARTPAEAAREIGRFLARTDDPVHRDLALHALARTGPAGLAEAKRLRGGSGDRYDGHPDDRPDDRADELQPS